MAQEPDRPRYDGFLPGSYLIDGYAAGGFTFAGMSHRGSILALPDAIRAWPVGGLADVTAANLQPVLAAPQGSIDFLLFGTGARLEPLPRDLRELLRAHGLRSDPMATPHAVATYNILLGERRRVAAALLAVP